MTNFLISVVAGIFLLIIGYYFKIIKKVFDMRGQKKIWKPFINSDKDIKVILTTREGPHKRSTPRVSLNEVLAFSNIRNVFLSFGREVELDTSDTRGVDSHDNSIIALGGPTANKVSETLLSRFEKKLPFYFDKKINSINVAGRKYTPLYDDEGLVIKDFGVVFRVILDPTDKKSECALVAFGCHGYGTLGAILAVIQNNLVTEIVKKIQHQDFAVILSVDLNKRNVIKTTIEECYSILHK